MDAGQLTRPVGMGTSMALVVRFPPAALQPLGGKDRLKPGLQREAEKPA